jgi:hypothetical protein
LFAQARLLEDEDSVSLSTVDEVDAKRRAAEEELLAAQNLRIYYESRLEKADEILREAKDWRAQLEEKERDLKMREAALKALESRRRSSVTRRGSL